MKNEDSYRKLEAIKDLIETRSDDYLRIVEKAKRTLAIYLGTDYMQTNFAEEILHEVFCDLIDGTRHWDINKYTIEQVVFMDMKSEISNLIKREKRYISIDEYSDEHLDNIYNTENIFFVDQEDLDGIIDAENIERYCYDKILQNDSEGQIVLSEMLEGKTQKQIAEYLGITIRAAEVHIERIRRKIRAHLPSCLLKNVSHELVLQIYNNKREPNNGREDKQTT